MIKSSLLVLLSFVFWQVSAEFAPTYVTKSYNMPLRTGYVRSKADDAFFARGERTSFAKMKASVPASFSLRGSAGPVENQGNCGSCWDFALTSALRGSWMSVGKDPGRLSFNYLLNCATEQLGCHGGSFNAAEWFVSPKGAPAYGSDGEYTHAQGRCVSASPAASTQTYKILGNPNAVTFKDIAYVVGVLHRPVAVDIFADSDLKAYSAGVYNDCFGWWYTNHMVVVEGYDCESSVDSSGRCVFDDNGNLPAGVGTYTIRNSWGKTWGDHGYLTIKATGSSGGKCKNVASAAIYFDVTGADH